jgi:hypothetical protein
LVAKTSKPTAPRCPLGVEWDDLSNVGIPEVQGPDHLHRSYGKHRTENANR